ncbi:response regulator [Desulfopila aestuarii]|uniref:Putative two-component system response regulator n=1 Tax=Desulfopila aestuarii DSM 18488 TaxID=1121416 RepID=A0A1M7YG95_9BACT|nr:HD domain-containing phosphohydrolase [Desulfopila aestuarii]SHO51606.1 putative two-component system response regulator [Desulfopila aestuarii DSM 18488]
MKTEKLLIVDDTVEHIHLLMNILKCQYALVAAKTGEHAFMLACSDPQPDCILLDIQMPGISGFELCKMLKHDIRTAAIPIIFITSLADEDDEAQGLSIGAADYITKPFRPAIVRSRVWNQLKLKQHRDHLDRLVIERSRELTLIKEITIETLAHLTEYRDPETGGHIRRTQNYVRLLAEEASSHSRYAPYLTTEQIDLLFISAPLHDIGKVAIPDTILFKPDALSKEQFDTMKRHTVYGGDCLARAERQLIRSPQANRVVDSLKIHAASAVKEDRSSVDLQQVEGSFLSLAKDICYSHHEKWNGSGYPMNLSAEDIPLCGRIMAIADVYDALISKRVYKPPFTHGKAVSIIAAEKGKHFDPVLVEAFLEVEEQFRLIALEFVDSDEEQQALLH